MVDALDLKSNDFFDLEGSSPLVPSEKNVKDFLVRLQFKKIPEIFSFLHNI